MRTMENQSLHGLPGS